MVRQDRTHNRPLRPRPPAVNDANLRDAVPDTFLQVVADDARNIPRRESVKVETILDRENQRGLFRFWSVRKTGLLFRIGWARRHRGSGGQSACGGRCARKGLTAS